MRKLVFALLLLFSVPQLGRAQGLFGMIKTPVQFGAVTISNGNTSGTASITAVDLTRAELRYYGKQTDTSAFTSGVCRIALTNATTVTATRVGIVNNCIVAFEVIEWNLAPKSIQSGTVTIPNASTSNTATLGTAIDTNKAHINFLGTSTDNTGNIQNSSCSITITNPTTITASRLSNSDNCVVSYMVVDPY